MEDDEIIGEFLAECHEGLERIEQGLMVLEATPDDTQTLTEVFRILHTIKGTCGFLGFGQLETVAHRGENLLSLLRDSVLEMDQEITDALLATNDAIGAILSTIGATGDEGSHDNATLIACLERLSARAEHVGAAADPVAGTTGVEPSGALDAGEVPPRPDDEVDVTADGREIDDDARDQAADDDAAGAGRRLGDILVEDGTADRFDVEIAAVQQSLGDSRPIGDILVAEGRADKCDVDSAAARQRGAGDSSIRVDVGVLDTLMNLVGELVLSRNEIVQLTGDDRNEGFVAPAQRLNLITSELQESVMKTRMQPIVGIWNKLPRVVRDLSQQFDKRIRLEMEGKETELDRTILEAVKDPLTHMIRNTVDHGIESPEVRVAAGKDPEGVLRLSASHEGGQVHIEISDDGGGIDAAAVRRTAVDKGVVSADDAEQMSDAAAIQLIFAPGFSTAAKVNNVSGRGVGMDVVRTNIERIGGSVEVRTSIGVGTSFKIKIPLTLAIIPALIVWCDGRRYALPQLSLRELVRLGPGQRIEDVHGAPVFRLRDRLLPIVDLRAELAASEPAGHDAANIVVLQADGRSFGLIVDAIVDTEEIVIKPLGRTVSDSELFSGATVMGDGSVALILDVNGLASASRVLGSGGSADDVDVDVVGDGLIDAIDDRTVLLVGLRGGERAAIPLEQVDRLEEFAPSDVERSDHRDVVQYRDEVITLVDLGPTTGRGSPAIDRMGPLSVVVCSSPGGASVGVAVEEVLDIVSRPDVRRDAEGAVGSVVVEGRIVDLIDARSLVPGSVDSMEPLLVFGAS
ncbi:chemotaxis protein CheW [Ilumatobacter sp.]|uniref:chemotaxis protein CheW n=1 Tax=Ilumatobacter sp. TaxID=1967498 RepID=UPI003B52F31C